MEADVQCFKTVETIETWEAPVSDHELTPFSGNVAQKPLPVTLEA